MIDPMGTGDMLELLAAADRGEARKVRVRKASAKRTSITDEVNAILRAMQPDRKSKADHRAPDRTRVVEAIVLEARSARAYVDPNKVRARLTLSDDPSIGGCVSPAVVGTVYGVLIRRGILAPADWIPSTNTRKGAGGRPIRAYHLTRVAPVPTEQENHS